MRAVFLSLAFAGLLLAGAALPRPPAPEAEALPEALLSSCYLSQEDPVYTYLQNNSIRRFWDMWFGEQFGEDVQAHWAYDALAPVRLLDGAGKDAAPDGQGLYACPFSTDDGRCGYLIVSYGVGGEGPYISKWRLAETTPRLYDLRANAAQVSAALRAAGAEPVSALRAELLDTGQSVLLFTDGAGGRFLCDLGAETLTVETWEMEGPPP